MSDDLRPLFQTKRFLPLFITLFLGALNDNLFKNALTILVLFRIADQAGKSGQILVTVAAGIFILPFFLFSATAGQLADNRALFSLDGGIMGFRRPVLQRVERQNGLELGLGGAVDGAQDGIVKRSARVEGGLEGGLGGLGGIGLGAARREGGRRGDYRLRGGRRGPAVKHLRRRRRQGHGNGRRDIGV